VNCIVPNEISLFDRCYPGLVKEKYYEFLIQKGAVSLYYCSDELGEKNCRR